MIDNMNVIYFFLKKNPECIGKLPVSGEDRWLPVSWDLFD